ncbi:MAG: SRPBCC family protein [Moraxellaceae bacterium]
MLEFQVEKNYAHSADKVWAIIGDFGGLQSWMPGVLACRVEGEGAVDKGGNAERIVDVMDGSVTRERLEEFSPEQRRFVYSIQAARGFDASSEYFGTVCVIPEGEAACRVTWSARFRLPDGIPAEKGPRACERIAAMYSMCLANLEAVLAAG